MLTDDLSAQGFTKGYFPFSIDDLKVIENLDEQTQEKSISERKNLFTLHPGLKIYFTKALLSIIPEATLSEYCFYIEKNQHKNWPLAMHRDLNFPYYIRAHSDFDRDEWLLVSS